MSSNVHHLHYKPCDTRMLGEMLKRAGYVTAHMEPLQAEDREASAVLLARFRGSIQPVSS